MDAITMEPSMLKTAMRKMGLKERAEELLDILYELRFFCFLFSILHYQFSIKP